jgi:hypothetical protein
MSIRASPPRRRVRAAFALPRAPALLLLVAFLSTLLPRSARSARSARSGALLRARRWVDPMHGRPSAPVDGCSANGCCCCINTHPHVVKSNHMGKRAASADVPCVAGMGQQGDPAKGWVVVFCREACTSSHDGFLLDSVQEEWVNNGAACAMHCQNRIGLSRCPPGQVEDPDSSTGRCVYERR